MCKSDKPNFTDHYHVIAVKDLGEAVKYYRDILGFDVDDRGVDGWQWFVNGPVTIMAGLCPEEVPAGGTNNHSYFLRVMLEGIDSYYKAIKGEGGEFAEEIENKPWGFREFCVRTNEGHRIVFAKYIGVV